MIGAGSVITKDVPNNSLVTGNPASVVSSYDDYMKKQKIKFETAHVYDENYTFRGHITADKKQKMKQEIGTEKSGFIK